MENEEKVINLLQEISDKMNLLNDLNREMREIKVRIQDIKQ